MYGFQSYPSKIENYRTSLFDYFKKKFYLLVLLIIQFMDYQMI